MQLHVLCQFKRVTVTANVAKMDLPVKDIREEKKTQEKACTVLYIDLYIAYKSTYGN